MKIHGSVLMGVCIIIWASACAPGAHRPAADLPPVTAGLGPDSPLDAGQRAWVERTLSELTIREMAGQVIVAWIPGSYLSTDSEEFDRAVDLVESGVGGLWMMGGLPLARTAKINALQARASVPLLVSGSGFFGHRLFAPRRDAWVLGGGTDLPPQLAYGANRRSRGRTGSLPHRWRGDAGDGRAYRGRARGQRSHELG